MENERIYNLKSNRSKKHTENMGLSDREEGETYESIREESY
jgi:hypothetical protein